MLPDCLQCKTSSDKPLKQFKPLLCVLFKIQPWLSCGFLKYASNYCHAWVAGKTPSLNGQTSARVRQPCSLWGGCVVRALCGLLRNCKNNIKKNLKCLHFREIWPYGFDWSIISSFKSSDQIIELINDFPWFYMCWHELSLSAAY